MFWKSVVAQAIHKWPVTLLLLVALTAVVSLYVYLQNSARFSIRSMQLIMKNIGYNLVILPRETRPFDHYAGTNAETLFTEEVCRVMAQDLRLPARYYANILQRRVEVRGRNALLTGMAPVHRADETDEKGHLYQSIPTGSAELGAVIARELELVAGAELVIRDYSFRVDRIHAFRGTIDDSRIWVNLETVQEMLNEPGMVNAVFAFLCQVGRSLDGALGRLDQHITARFPDFQVIPKMNILQGRFLARMTTGRYLDYLLSLVLLVTVLLIIVTGLQEVAERKTEAGILLALGAGYPYIIALYLVKLLTLALLSAVTGFLTGSLLSRSLLGPVLAWETQPVDIVWRLLPQTIYLTCGIVLLAAIIPLVRLVSTNPNLVLTES